MGKIQRGFVSAVWAVGLGAWVLGHAASAAATGPGCPAGVVGPWVGVAPARGGEWVIAWTEHQIVAADPTGRWQVIDQGADVVEAAAIGADGTAWAIRNRESGSRVLRIPAGAPAVEVPTPGDDYLGGIDVGGGRVAIRTGAGLLVGPARGSRFRDVDVGTAYAGGYAAAADGTVNVLEVEVNTCGSSDRLDWVRRHRVDRNGAVQTADVPSAYGLRTTIFHAGAFGWIYADDWTSLWALTSRKARRVRGWAPAGGTRGAQVVAGDARTVALLGRELVDLRGTRAHVLSRDAPADLVLDAVDARGRPLGIAEGTIWRWARRTGWERLLPTFPP